MCIILHKLKNNSEKVYFSRCNRENKILTKVIKHKNLILSHIKNIILDLFQTNNGVSVEFLSISHHSFLLLSGWTFQNIKDEFQKIHSKIN